MIILNNICHAYIDSKYVLRNINLKITSNGLYSIMGTSGSGKSTLLNIISRFLKPTSGSITGNAEIPANFFQDHKLFNFLTVKENIEIVNNFYDRNIDYSNLYKEYNIEHILNSYPTTISGGEKARVALVRMIATGSHIFLIDEPTAELDEISSIQIMGLIKKLSEKNIVILVSHNRSLVEEYSDEIYLLEKGGLKITNSRTSVTKTTTRYSKTEQLETNNKIKYLFENFKQFIKFNYQMNKNRKWRIIVSSGVIGIIFTILVIILSFLSNIRIINQNIYNSKASSTFIEIYKKEDIYINQNLSLKKQRCLRQYEINDLQNIFDNKLNFVDNLSLFIPETIAIEHKNEVYNISLVPINKAELNLNVVGNSKLKKILKEEKIKIKINLNNTFELKSGEIGNLTYDISSQIVSFSNDIDILDIPIVYYDYENFKRFLMEQYLDIDETNKISLSVFLEGRMCLSEKHEIHKNWVFAESSYLIYEKLKKSDFFTSSKNIDQITNFEDIAKTLAYLFTIFLIITLVVVFSFLFISIQTLYEENKKSYATIKSFSIKSTKFNGYINSMFLFFAFASSLVFITLNLVFNLCVNLVTKMISELAFMNLNINLFIALGGILLIFIFCYLGAFLPQREIQKSDLISILRGED